MTESLIAYAIFASIAAFTPGPNNLMVSASGANYGFRRTLPHMLGVALGFPFLLLCIGLGFGELFTRYPVLHATLKFAGAAYLLYLAWLIASADTKSSNGDNIDGKPLTFMQAALFQWVNPKGWAVNVSAIVTYTTLENYGLQLALMIVAATLIAFASTSTWTLFGQGISRLLSTPRQHRVFNIVMGLLLVGTLYPILMS